MKKIGRLAVIIILVVSLAGISLTALSSCNNSGENEIAIITDIHVMAEAQIGSTITDSFLVKDAQSQKMLYVSEAIFRSALDKIEASGAKTLLIAGDLTEDGAKISHETVSAELKKLEAKGVEVFVINGNHDIRNSSKSYTGEEAVSIANVTPEDFKEIYADFGYSAAISAYEGTLSYSADIGKKYRLIAIDASHYTPEEGGGIIDRNDPALTDGLIRWAAEQVAQAVKDKRTPIGMMHFPLVQHFGSFVDSTGIAENGKVNKSEELAVALNAAGLDYIFTGHVHTQDISAYQDDNGKLFDVMTGCLSNYPAPIRYLSSDRKSITLTTELLDSVNASYIPACAAGDSDDLVNHFQRFASNFANNDMIGKLLNKLSFELYESILSSFITDYSELVVESIRSLANDIIEDFLRLKVYGSGKSLETIAAGYGVTLPQSNYTNIMSVAMSLIKANFSGDENITPDMTEVKLFKYSIYAIFHLLDSFYLAAANFIRELPDINLSIAAESLFQTGELDLVALDLGELLSPILADFLKTPVSEDPYEMLAALSAVDFGAKLFGIDVQNYFDSENGTIRVEALLDYILFDFAKDNLTLDVAPGDNNIRINKKTQEVENL